MSSNEQLQMVTCRFRIGLQIEENKVYPPVCRKKYQITKGLGCFIKLHLYGFRQGWEKLLLLQVYIHVYSMTATWQTLPVLLPSDITLAGLGFLPPIRGITLQHCHMYFQTIHNTLSYSILHFTTLHPVLYGLHQRWKSGMQGFRGN